MEMRSRNGQFLGTKPRPRLVTTCECGNHAFVSLTKWGVTMVSPQDAYLLIANAWYLGSARNGRCYVQSKRTYLSRKIIQTPKGMDTDHIDGNTLDNRRSNLRPVSRADNIRNRHAPPPGASGFRGVSFSKTCSLWLAYYFFGGKTRTVGYFKTAEEAAKARDKMCKALFGDIQTMNFKP